MHAFSLWLVRACIVAGCSAVWVWACGGPRPVRPPVDGDLPPATPVRRKPIPSAIPAASVAQVAPVRETVPEPTPAVVPVRCELPAARDVALPECMTDGLEHSARPTNKAQSGNPACALARRQARRVFAPMPRIEACGSDGSFDPHEPFGPCFGSPDGSAWAVWVDRATLRPLDGARSTAPAQRSPCSYEVSGSAVFAFITAQGRVLRGPKLKISESGFVSSRFTARPDEVPLAFDYDSDGLPEAVFLHGRTVGGSGGTVVTSGSVWTVSRGRIGPYPGVPQGVLGTTDADCDGRPDLLYEGPFFWGPCASPMGCSQYAPKLLAHSLADGTFSVDDGVAHDWARRQCPCPEQGLPDDLMVAHAAARCARLWGRTARDLASDYKRLCPEKLDPTDFWGRPLCDSLKRMLAAEPPLRLAPPKP